MAQIFLSASIPVQGRGDFFESADPFLIQFAVRELLAVCLGRRRIVWGGHPAITPMVWAVCESLDVSYAAAVRLYQSKFFSEWFPEENRRFGNVKFTPAVIGDRTGSLDLLRRTMLAEPFEAAVFIGGMDGIFDEYNIFREFHPDAKIVTVSAPGGAAMQLARRLRQRNSGIDFARIFHRKLGIASTEPRDQVENLEL
ncbi:MAG: hypothetical protein ACN6PM_21040 [Achromobacter mucicolens]|uniref:SLOG domain-containing protein n=1 Tax=Achromobacter mucicolens TaxID=1389922 RepID=UPI003D11CFA9